MLLPKVVILWWLALVLIAAATLRNSGVSGR
jgi:hypothetical protein